MKKAMKFRVALMIAMLEKRAGLQLLGDDVFVNIAGGLEVDEPAVDLGLVTAIASSGPSTSTGVAPTWSAAWPSCRPNSCAPLLNSIARPFLRVFQKRIPPVGNVDLSPLFVLVVCQIVLMATAWLESGVVHGIG